MRILARLLLILSALGGGLLLPSSAQAEVTVTFYSREFGEKFPHAFFATSGTTANGTKVDNNYGFTAKSISPSILFGRVTGVVKPASASYVAKSTPHFRVKVSDGQYRALLALAAEWQALPQKSYSLNKRNCVHFTEAAIRLLGYQTNPNTKFWKKPTSFMKEIMALNPGLKL